MTLLTGWKTAGDAILHGDEFEWGLDLVLDGIERAAQGA